MPYIICGTLVFALGICIGNLMEQAIHKREARNAVYQDDFCWDHCKIHEEVYGNFKDPDDAWKELDDGGWCEGCPLCMAMDIIDEETLRKWERKKKK